MRPVTAQKSPSAVWPKSFPKHHHSRQHSPSGPNMFPQDHLSQALLSPGPVACIPRTGVPRLGISTPDEALMLCSQCIDSIIIEHGVSFPACLASRSQPRDGSWLASRMGDMRYAPRSTNPFPWSARLSTNILLTQCADEEPSLADWESLLGETG